MVYENEAEEVVKETAGEEEGEDEEEEEEGATRIMRHTHHIEPSSSERLAREGGRERPMI